MVVGHRMHESREYSVVTVLCNRCRIEANSGDWVDLEDSVARVVHGGRGIRLLGAKYLWHGLTTWGFSYVF